MIDLSNKIFRTKNDAESERLLHIAVAQGYKLPAGLKSLVKHDCFKFTGFPYKTVSFPKYADENSVIDYADAFGDEYITTLMMNSGILSEKQIGSLKIIKFVMLQHMELKRFA